MYSEGRGYAIMFKRNSSVHIRNETQCTPYLNIGRKKIKFKSSEFRSLYLEKNSELNKTGTPNVKCRLTLNFT